MNQNKTITIEIAIPVYQGGKNLEHSIQSVLAQDYSNFILTIVDDGSSDETLAIARRYAAADNRIRVYAHTRSGASVQRNYILSHNHTDWLLWLDCGDLLAPDCLKRRLEFVDSAGYASNDPVVVIGSIYNIHPDSICPQIGQDKLDWIDGCNTLDNLLTFSITGHIGLHYGGMLSRGAIERILLVESVLYPKDMKNGPDYIAATRLAAASVEFIYQKEPLVTVVYEPDTAEQGDMTNKLIARFEDFCRGAEYHQPYFEDNNQFMRNALACHFYRRARVLEKLQSEDPRKALYTTKADQLARDYNIYARSLSELIQYCPTIRDKVHLLKNFDCTSTSLTWVPFMGVDIALHKEVRILRRLLTHREYENTLLEQMISFINKNDIKIFIDLGASAGIYSAVLSVKCPILEEVHAFEPTPDHYRLLRATIERLESKSASKTIFNCYPWAVGNHCNEPQKLLISKSFGGANRLASTVKEDANIIASHGKVILPDIHGSNIKVSFDEILEIPCVSLDSIFSFHGQKIAIKIDIEGNEFAALAGMQSLLDSNTCLLQIETNPDSKENLICAMKNYGYSHFLTIGRDHYFSKDLNKIV